MATGLLLARSYRDSTALDAVGAVKLGSASPTIAVGLLAMYPVMANVRCDRVRRHPAQSLLVPGDCTHGPWSFLGKGTSHSPKRCGGAR